MARNIKASIEISALDPENNFQDNSEPQFLSSEITSCFYEYPLKIMIPQSTSDSCCRWIYPVTFGGGLVEGDKINMSVKVGKKCCALLTTLSYPKVYCCENGLDSEQHVQYHICSHALLCVLPDPLVCYKNASYIQTQSFYLEPDANVVSLDWFTSGRYERGEIWDFTRLKSVSMFYMNNKLSFKEAQNIQNIHPISIKKAMKMYNCFGSCIIVGQELSFLYEKVLSQLGKCLGYGERCQADPLFTVSPLHISDTTNPVGCAVRFASVSVSKAVQEIEKLLEPLFDIVGENPFRNK